MLSVTEAETIILEQILPLTEIESVTLETAYGRVLGREITSDLDFPYWDNSAMDGYAVRYEDVKRANADHPVILEIIEEIPAGKSPQKSVNTGETARIFTGAILPLGADTIVIQENTEKMADQVAILSPPDNESAFVRQRGAFYTAGNPLLTAGISIKAPEIAVLATAQCPELPVFRRPRVVIFSTGDELVSPNQPLQAGQIVDSNSYALTAFVASLGAIPIPLGIVRDHVNDLRNTIKQAITEGDIVLSTGGVSVGDHDYVERLLEELGGEILIRRVAIQPGKPLTVATFANGCLYFGIPGNPVSALVSAWRFVQPALKKLSGLLDYRHQFIEVITRDSLKSQGQREVYLWGRVEIVNGVYEFHLAPGQHNSANLINLARTNALAIVPRGEKLISAGKKVTVMLIQP